LANQDQVQTYAELGSAKRGQPMSA